MGVKASDAPKTARKAANRTPKIIRHNSQPAPECCPSVRFAGKEARCFIGLSSLISCRLAQEQRGNEQFQNYPSKRFYAVFTRNYRSAIHPNQVLLGTSQIMGNAKSDSPNGQVGT